MKTVFFVIWIYGKVAMTMDVPKSLDECIAYANSAQTSVMMLPDTVELRDENGILIPKNEIKIGCIQSDKRPELGSK